MIVGLIAVWALHLRIGLNHPCGSLPTEKILWFYEIPDLIFTSILANQLVLLFILKPIRIWITHFFPFSSLPLASRLALSQPWGIKVRKETGNDDLRSTVNWVNGNEHDEMSIILSLTMASTELGQCALPRHWQRIIYHLVHYEE